MKKLPIACGFSGFLCLLLSLSAQTFNTLHSFDQTDGAEPEAGLVQATDGNLYGTTYHGGIGNFGFGGTVYNITPGGTLTTLYNFCNLTQCEDGANPYAGVVQASNGNLYGATSQGGTIYGVVFEVTPGGGFSALDSFNNTDGANPQASLVLGTDGNLYGTTPFGEATTACPQGCGTVFKLTPGGTLTTLHTFVETDGSRPLARMIQGTDGNFYGTTFGGGTSHNGTVFKITPGGTLTTLHSFTGSDGATPYAGLVQASNGNFYGTTLAGGIGKGTLFQITPGGTLTTVYIFCSLGGVCPDGENPHGDLIQASDGNLYGTTTGAGGSSNGGTAFKVDARGTLTTIYTFCSQGGNKCTDGLSPVAGLVQDTNGTFYGTTSAGGASGEGTVFSLSVGLSPFVKALPASGKVGANVTILGTGLTGTTSVEFGSTAAQFTVVSDSEITTTVPAGATTALLSVTTPGGTRKSTRKFLVIPQVLSFIPTSGPVGTVVTITGVSLTQTEGVGFGDRVPAAFTVNSDTELTATVPSGARTGPVGAETPGGTGISSKTFTVTP
jgi:uncharacterized repeat protein (TIGR03803 family)